MVRHPAEAAPGRKGVGPKDNHTLSQKYVQVHMVHSPGARGPQGEPTPFFWLPAMKQKIGRRVRAPLVP